MKTVITLLLGVCGMLFSNVAEAYEYNLSPSYEREIVKSTVKRPMSIEAKRDLNVLYQKLERAYQKAKKEGIIEEVDYMVSAYDLNPHTNFLTKTGRINKTSNISGWTKSKEYSGKALYDNCVIFVLEEDVIDIEDDRILIFKLNGRTYRSCIYRATKSKLKKDREKKNRN